MTILLSQGGALVFSGSLLLTQPSSNQFKYYISPNGSDTNPGTLNLPWSIRSLLNPTATTATTQSKANRLLTAGQRVGIIGDQGPYTNIWSLVGSPGGLNYQQAMLLLPEGSPGTPTWVQSCSSSGAPAGPHLPGTTAATLNAGLTDANNSGTVGPNIGAGVIGHHGNIGYVNIVGLEITGFNSFGVACGNWGGNIFPVGVITQYNYIHGANGNGGGVNIAGVTYRGVAGSGFGIGAADSYCSNNYLTSIVDNSGNNRSSGIEYWVCRGCSMKYNTLIHSGTAGDFSSVLFYKNTGQFGNRTYNNFVDLSLGTYSSPQLFTDGEDNSGPNPPYSKYVQNNIGIMSASSLGTDAYWSTSGVTNPAQLGTLQHYINNTFVNGVTGLFRNGKPLTITGYNNIFTASNFGGGYGFWITNSDALALIDYNCYSATKFQCALVPSGVNGSGSATAYTTLAAWRAAVHAGQPSCVGFDTNAIQHNPNFIGIGPYASAWKLQAGDACLTSGSSNGTTGGTPIQAGAWGGTDNDSGGPITQIGAVWLQ